MDQLTNTFKSLLKIAGKILFVIGLVLSIYALSWGFWPPFACILIVLAGAGLVILNKDADNEELGDNDTHWFTKILNTVASFLKKTDARSIEKVVKTTLIILIATFISIIAVFSLSQDYFKKRDTINGCKEITTALEKYKQSTKAYPTALSELRNPLLSVHDQWGNMYNYQSLNNGGQFILTSAGLDGKFNTADDLVFKN